MTVVLVVVCGAVVVGVITTLVALRWPTHGVSAPGGRLKQTVRWLIRHPRTLATVERHLDARTAVGLALSGLFVLLLSGLMVVGALLALLGGGSTAARLDRSLAEWGAERADDRTVEVLLQFTRFGATEIVVAIALVIVAVEWRRRGRAVLTYLAVVIGGVTVVLNVVKHVVDRDRPAVRQLANFAASSFPSGHAATAAASFAAFAMVLGRKRPNAVKALAMGCAAMIAVATAGSRVFLGVHWLTDVIAGVALGWAWFAVTTIAFGGRLLRFGAPIEAAERATETSTQDDDKGVRVARP